jgi:hypothetical protein
MNYDDWLSRIQQGNLLIEVTSSAHTLVRVTERKNNRIWYASESGPSNLRCVDARTGWSSDMSRHLIPQEAHEDDFEDRIWDMYGPATITDPLC